MKTKIFIFLLILFTSAKIHAFDITNLFKHPEIANKNSIFTDIGFAPLTLIEFEFPVLPFELRIDYLLPFPLPFSLGIFMKAPNPNFKHFGVRFGYHFNIIDDLTDLYLVYSFDFGFFRNDILLEYNDTPVPVHYYDFRIGIRRFFKSRYGVAVETGYKFDTFIISFCIKIN